MKNYYEILEVDKNASPEVIEKAYKALVKKYHPDLQQGVKQEEYAEKMKIINEAYDVLSNDFKREQYNQTLQTEQTQNQGISSEEKERIIRENYALKQELNRMAYQNQKQQQAQEQEIDDNTIINMSRILNQEIRAARNKAYQDAYIQDMKNRGYKIKYTHDFKYYLKAILAFAIMAFAFFIIYQIPFVKSFFNNLYEENIVFQAIVDIFKNTFSAGF